MEPKFDHSKDKIYKAVGISPEFYTELRKFQRLNVDIPAFNKPSEYMEYYWNRFPEKLKKEPFAMFYLGMFLGDAIRSATNLDSIVLN
jgi:hypothetical protein